VDEPDQGYVNGGGSLEFASSISLSSVRSPDPWISSAVLIRSWSSFGGASNAPGMCRRIYAFSKTEETGSR
jgi:hypothetical protein